MKLIGWTERFNVNIEEIDSQHQEIINLINELTIVPKDENIFIVHKCLVKLRKYAHFHFSCEEKYLQSLSPEAKTRHLKQHAYFIEKVVFFTDKAKVGKQVEIEELLSFLRTWVVEHITEDDQCLKNCDVEVLLAKTS